MKVLKTAAEFRYDGSAEMTDGSDDGSVDMSDGSGDGSGDMSDGSEVTGRTKKKKRTEL